MTEPEINVPDGRQVATGLRGQGFPWGAAMSNFLPFDLCRAEPDVLIFYALQKMYRSEDGGKTWIDSANRPAGEHGGFIGRGNSNVCVNDFDISPSSDDVYFACQDKGLLVSPDNGTSLKKVLDSVNFCRHTKAVAFDPTVPGKCYFAHIKPGGGSPQLVFFKTKDFGKSFEGLIRAGNRSANHTYTIPIPEVQHPTGTSVLLVDPLSAPDRRTLFLGNSVGIATPRSICGIKFNPRNPRRGLVHHLGLRRLQDRGSEGRVISAMRTRMTLYEDGRRSTFFQLISAAFFETDAERLVAMALRAVPNEGPFQEGMRDVVDWHKQHPDWRTTRQLIHERYWAYEKGDYKAPVSGVSSLCNGLCGIMAVLYGQGDFMKTTGIAVSAGCDCDNQSATCGGLIGVMHGSDCIPDALTKDFITEGRWAKYGWSRPFNDQYLNYSRDGLPIMTKISDIAQRIVAVVEQAILDGGGRKETRDGKTIYVVNCDF